MLKHDKNKAMSRLETGRKNIAFFRLLLCVLIRGRGGARLLR